MPFIDLDGGRFFYQVRGEGPPVVLIAGFGCDHSFWAPVDLPGFRVLSFDHRGVGRTVDDGRPLSAGGLAEDALALASALGWERAAVVGQSMGGTVALTLAARHPGFVSRLGLVTTSLRWREGMLRTFRALLRVTDPDLLADLSVPWMFSDWGKADAAKAFALAHPAVADRARQMAVLEGWDGRGLTVSSPVMVGFGKFDLLATPGEALDLHRQLGGTLHEFPCAHAITTEAPGELAAWLVEGLG